MDDQNKFQNHKTLIIKGMAAVINNKQQENEEESNIQDTQQNLQIINAQVLIQQQINSSSPQNQITILNKELDKLDDNKALTKAQKKFYKAKYSQQLLENLQQTGQAKPITIPPNVNQIINQENLDVLFYTLKESLLRDQNRELLKTDSPVYAGLESLVGAFGQDQGCLKFRTDQVDYNKLTTDNQFRNQYLYELKQKIANYYKIHIDQVQILGINKGSTEILIKIISSEINLHNQKDIDFFKNVCGGSIEYYNYFVQAQYGYLNQTTQDSTLCSNQIAQNAQKKKGKLGLSNLDFNPDYNMTWDDFPVKEKRGPPDNRYDYYFPKGCQGFGLNINQKGYKNMNWIQMDGNKDEWRILFHGTQQEFVAGITKDKLQQGARQAYSNDISKDGRKIGKGIYFSDDIKVCLEYAQPAQVGQKRFSVVFMSRVNPKTIKQSLEMIQKRYFVVNNSVDVRPYRILLKEV